jgi:hypothetical protein
MFNATDHAVVSSDSGAITYGDQPPLASFLTDVSVSGVAIDLRAVPIGTNILVDTRNSRYRLVLREGDGRDVVVQGGRYFHQETEVRVNGSTLGGSLLKIGWIGVGLFLEFSLRGKRIVTSRVCSISVEPFRA